MFSETLGKGVGFEALGDVKHGGSLSKGWHNQSQQEEDRIDQSTKVSQWGRGGGKVRRRLQWSR